MFTSLSKAIETPYPDYEKIGVVVNGEYRPLTVISCKLKTSLQHYSAQANYQLRRKTHTGSLKNRGRSLYRNALS